MTKKERYDLIRKQYPVLYHGRDVEDVYQEYIEGTRTFDEIAKEYRSL